MLAGHFVTVIARLGMGMWEGGGSCDILVFEQIVFPFQFQGDRLLNRDPRAGALM